MTTFTFDINTGSRAIRDEEGYAIAHTSGLHDDARDERNARLFAAAPALLAFAKAYDARVTEFFARVPVKDPELEKLWRQCREAILAAEGPPQRKVKATITEVVSYEIEVDVAEGEDPQEVATEVFLQSADLGGSVDERVVVIHEGR